MQLRHLYCVSFGICLVLAACSSSPNEDANNDNVIDDGQWHVVGQAGFSAGAANYQSMVIAAEPIVAYANPIAANTNNTATVMEYGNNAWDYLGTDGNNISKSDSTAFEDLFSDATGALYLAYQNNSIQSPGSTTVMQLQPQTNTWIMLLKFPAILAPFSYQNIGYDTQNSNMYVSYQIDTASPQVELQQCGVIACKKLSTKTGKQPQLAVAPGIAYSAYIDEQNAFVLSMYVDNSISSTIKPQDDPSINHPSVVSTANGLTAFYTLSSATKINIIKYTADDIWLNNDETDLGFITESNTSYAQIKLNAQNILYVAYQAADVNHSIKVFQLDDQQHVWQQIGNSIPTGTIAYDKEHGIGGMSLAIAPDGTVYIAYSDNIAAGGKTTVQRIKVN